MQARAIHSRQNSAFKEQQKVLRQASFRRKQGLIWLEGSKSLDQVPLKKIKTLFLGPKVPEGPWPAQPYRLSAELAKLAFTTENLQSVGCLVSWIPDDFEAISWKQDILVLDGLQDPGNVGSLIRTAAGLGVGTVILLNSVDPRNPKVIRSTAGALFKIPLIENPPFEKLQSKLKTHKISPVIAQAHGSGHLIQKIKSPWALVLGSEAHGPNPAWQGSKCSIQLANHIESLNAAAAGAILMSQLKGLFLKD